MRKRIHSAAFAICLVTGAFGTQAYGADSSSSHSPTGETSIQREVRHELATLSRYTVFDNITYRVDGTQVTLGGQVTQPVLKDDAENAVKGIAGVTNVNDQIEVLPLSPMDQGIRRAVFRAIYDDPDLNRYALAPSIHIIVKNGRVTLEGSVANEMDRDIANIRTNSVSGVFAVTNNLRINTNL
ncbi:MAG TPA: BON domain-containing protein [Bryobacteraceae bacterium]